MDKLVAKHSQLEDKIADMGDRLRRDALRVHGLPENAETLHVLAMGRNMLPKDHRSNWWGEVRLPMRSQKFCFDFSSLRSLHPLELHVGDLIFRF